MNPRRSLCAALAFGALLASAPAAQASTGVVGYVGSEVAGGGAGQLAEPRGVAVDANGDLYVADSGNQRVDEFSSSGTFLRAFGADVVRSGADNSNVDAQDTLTVTATGGTFRILARATVGEEHDLTSPLPFDASPQEVGAALESLPEIRAGNVSVSGGPGDASGSAPYLITFLGTFAGNEPELGLRPDFPEVEQTLTGSPHSISLGETATGGAREEVCNAAPPSDDICKTGVNNNGVDVGGAIQFPAGLAVDQVTGDVYVAAMTRINEFSATGQFIRAFGLRVVRSGPDLVTPQSAVQNLTVTAGGGSYTLEFGGQKTAALPAAAGAAEIQAALQALSSIGPENIDVVETEPGSYELAFAAALADNPEPTISAAPAPAPAEPLTGGTAAVHSTATGATGFDICEGAKGDVCERGEAGAGGGAFGGNAEALPALAVAPAGSPDQGNLLVADSANHRVEEFTESGAFLRAFGFEVAAAGPDHTGAGFQECIAAAGDACTSGSVGEAVGEFSGFFDPTSLAEDATGAIYTVEDREGFRVQKFTPQSGPPSLSPTVFGNLGAPDGAEEADTPQGVAIGAAGNVLVSRSFPEGATPECPDGSPSAQEIRLEELSADGSTLLATDASCNGIPSGGRSPSEGLAFDPTTRAAYLSSFSNSGPQRVYIIGPGATPPSIVPGTLTPNTAGATITATIDPDGPVGHPNPPTTSYRLEYRLASETGWRQFGGEVDLGSGEVGVPVTVHLGGLEGDRSYEARFVATKQFGEGVVTSAPEVFTTLPVPPSIDGLSASDLSTTTALLHAQVNPNGTDTTCRFEYGLTTSYGQTAPCEPTADIGSAHTDQSVEAHLIGLTEGATYHFRLLATNASGTTTSEDQSFEFLPPNCPNAAVRQQTGSDYLPDCRAYELVSPGNAQGTLFFPGGPNAGLATNPSRFSFVGAYSAIPGAEAIGTIGDLYVSTRTDGGWETHYIGPPGSEAPCAGGPPNQPRNNSMLTNPPGFFDAVPSDPTMSRFADWLDGTGINCAFGHNGVGDSASLLALASNAPFLWEADGSLVGRLPTDLETVPGAVAALDCPGETNLCSSDAAFSGDLTHFVFSSNRLSFAEGGLTEAPGSAYDDDLATGTVKKISVLEDGEDIPQDPTFAQVPVRGESEELAPGGAEEFLRFPSVSADGSHILISTATASTPVCALGNTDLKPCQRFTETPVHLYMSIDDEPAVEIAGGKAVDYLDMTPDGTKVFFTSEEQLTSEDKDHSNDLYMWSQKGEEVGHPLTLISKGDNEGNAGEPGNTDACHPAPAAIVERGQKLEGEAPWTHDCGVVPWSGYAYSWLPGGIGGNGVDDTAIASQNGDIYFYSPELLDGDSGIEGQQNLYDYRGGRVQFVATFQPGHHCVQPDPSHISTNEVCSEGPIVRMEVSPDDSHMALVTADRLTSYDNAGHLEMYSYTPATGALVCDSCRPDGRPPTSDVTASEDGLFMTDDGRTFFSTSDPLVPGDTNEGEDVYEFVDGRPQLITSGTGSATLSSNSILGLAALPGLVAVSANGTDVYFSTFDTLTAEDHNGSFLKFYDARAGGGFPQPPSLAPCAAAEECHGPGSEAPAPPQITSNGPPTRGGNAAVKKSTTGSCKKAKVRKKGRCLKKRRPKKGKRHDRRAKGKHHSRRAGHGRGSKK